MRRSKPGDEKALEGQAGTVLVDFTVWRLYHLFRGDDGRGIAVDVEGDREAEANTRNFAKRWPPFTGICTIIRRRSKPCIRRFSGIRIRRAHHVAMAKMFKSAEGTPEFAMRAAWGCISRMRYTFDPNEADAHLLQGYLDVEVMRTPSRRCCRGAGGIPVGDAKLTRGATWKRATDSHG